MEDPRLRVMYWKAFRESIERRLSRSRRRRVGTVTELLVGLLVVGTLIGQFEHHRGNYTKIKQRLATPVQQDTTPRPGGQEPIVLTRSPMPGSPNPEFASVTLLPGRGMDVLRITANIPGRGEVDLLSGSSIADATAAMTGTGEDSAGESNLTHGGPILTPWAGRLGGTISADGRSIMANWRGESFKVPANRVETEAPVAYGGLLSKSAAVDARMSPMPDGGSVTASFPMGEEGSPWQDLKTSVWVLMSNRVLDVTVSVKNMTGGEVPVGIGWAPRFLIPSGNRAKATLHLPASDRSLVADRRTGMPSGAVEAISGTSYGFNARNGIALGQTSLNDTFVHLKAKFDQSPTVELKDPGSRFGMRLMAMSPSIRAIHVYSPASSNFVSISPQMNYDDPFGKEWGGEDTGMRTLQPGETVEWKVRLELFSLMNGSMPAL